MDKVFRVELFGEKTNRWCELELPATYYGLLDALDKLQMTLGEKPRWEFLEHHGFVFLQDHLAHECDLYNSGASLRPIVGGYTCIRPAQSLPRIISSGSYPASIDAIRSYFTDEQVIRAIAGYVGMDFDTLICGDYKIVIEPIAYLVYGGANYAMTATEAALYDKTVDGDLRYWMGSLTHQNLPLAIFLEEADLGYPDGVGTYADFIRANWLGGRTTDCVGLIKGYGWLNPETLTIDYATNGMPDLGANQMYYSASVSGPIDTMPDIFTLQKSKGSVPPLWTWRSSSGSVARS